MSSDSTTKEEKARMRIERLEVRKAHVAGMRGKYRKPFPEAPSEDIDTAEQVPETADVPEMEALVKAIPVERHAIDKNQTASNIAIAMRERISSEPKASPKDSVALPPSLPADVATDDDAASILNLLLPQIRLAAIERIRLGYLDKFLCSLIVEVANAEPEET